MTKKLEYRSEYLIKLLMIKKKRNLTAVGLEPTPPKRLVPKTSALDHSATLPGMEAQAILTSLHFIWAELVQRRNWFIQRKNTSQIIERKTLYNRQDIEVLLSIDNKLK